MRALRDARVEAQAGAAAGGSRSQARPGGPQPQLGLQWGWEEGAKGTGARGGVWSGHHSVLTRLAMIVRPW